MTKNHVKKFIPVVLGALVLTSVAVFDVVNSDFFAATVKTSVQKNAKNKAVTTKQLEGVWKVQKDYLLNKESGKFELIPKVDPTNESYDQYFLFDGDNLCPAGGISSGGGKKYTCDGIGWLKYELQGSVLTMRKDLAYPGADVEKWELKFNKNDLEVAISDRKNDVDMRRIVKKMTGSKDFTRPSEAKVVVPVPQWR